MKQVGILGTGTWGMALARSLAINGNQVTMWSAIDSEIDVLNDKRAHPNLPKLVIPDSIVFTKDLESVCVNNKVLILAVPSIFVRSTTARIVPYITPEHIIVDVAKGIDSDTLQTMSMVINEELVSRDVKNIPVVALSGPTHAEEVSLDMPTTIVSACINVDAAREIQELFMSDSMRVYTNFDVLGVEICGALKNVIALAAGISTGLGYGDNATAAIITRGMREISAIGLAMGGSAHTFNGLAGIGDLVVTATSKHSRNNRCGNLIGQGVEVSEAVKQIGMAVEGLNALPAALKLVDKYSIDAPIIRGVGKIVNEGANPREVALELIRREKTSENEKSFLELNFENSIINNQRGGSMKRVITYGTFDLLHYGHINLLRRAKALGDYLVVVLSTDEFNWNSKQKKCYFTYEQRKALLETIRYVDLVIPETCWEQKVSDVHEYHIDTFVMGDDWQGKFDFLKDEGVEVVYLPRTPEISTTQIKKDLNK